VAEDALEHGGFPLDDVLQRRSLDHLPEIFTVED
jgi:hypothetical protein